MSSEGSLKVQFSQYSLLNTQNNPIKCIHAYDDYLYIGTSNKVMMYKLRPAKGVHVDNALEIEDTREAMGRSNVLGIQTDPIKKLCFVHFEGQNKKGHMVIYNLKLEDATPQKAIEDMVCFSLDQNFENGKMAVYANKKLQLYHYNDYEMGGQLEPGRTLASEIAWTYLQLIDHYLICYQRNSDNYNLIHLKSEEGEKSPNSADTDHNVDTANWWRWSNANSKLCKVPRVLHIEGKIAHIRYKYPNVWAPVYVDGNRYLLKKSEREKKMKKRAEPSGDVSPFIHLEETFKYLWADFSSEPKDVALCFPFVVGILPHRVEVYSLYASASNAVEDKGKNNVPVWHHALDAELCCASSKRFYVVDAKNNVFYFTPPSIDAQIKQLQGDFHIAQAQHLFAKRFEGANTKVKNQKLAEMQDNAAYSYLFRARFREAFEYMYKARKTSYEHRKDVRHVLQFFKDCSIMVGDQKIYPLIPSEFFVGFESGKKSMYGSMLSIQERLTNAINKTIPKNNSDISDSAWVEVLIGKALNNLIDFLEKVLEDMRQEKKKSESEQVQQACVEYLLIALYLRHVEGDPVSYNRIETTINHDNNCFNFDSTLRDKFVVLLKQANCYRHVALLIKSAGAGYYMPALNTLQKWIEKDIYYDVHNGVNDAIDILVRIDGPELMLDEVKPFISWIINQNPIKAVRIFTTPRKTMPDPVKVLEFLRAYPLSLKEKYLHYLLKVENSNEPAHHTDYAMTLIENILKLLPSKGGIYEAASNPRVRVKAQAPRDLLIGEYRNSLIEHLQESDVYDASTVLSRLEETVLFEELVTLYEKINQHKNALETIIFNLEEGDYAEDYCDRVHTNDLIRMEERHQVPDSNYNPYLVLLAETCVRPRGTYAEEKMNKSLLIMKDILNRRASDIDPIEVLRVLPDDIPASAIEGFLEQSIQYTHHRERTSKIKNRLSRNANMQVRSKHLKATSRKVIVHTHTVCPVCDQTIENAVFAVFPDLSVIHYRCLTSANSKKERMLKSTTVHPKTMLNYDRFPVDF